MTGMHHPGKLIEMAAGLMGDTLGMPLSLLLRSVQFPFWFPLALGEGLWRVGGALSLVVLTLSLP